MNTKERDRFEAWAKSMTFDISRHSKYPDSYKFPAVGVHWIAWKAALGIDGISQAQKDLDKAFGFEQSKVTP